MKSFLCANNFVIALDLQESCSEERKKYTKPKLLLCWKQPHLKSMKVIPPLIPCVCCLLHSLSPCSILFAFIRFRFLNLFTSVLHLCAGNCDTRDIFYYEILRNLFSSLFHPRMALVVSMCKKEGSRSCCLLWLMLCLIVCGFEVLFSYEHVKAPQKSEKRLNLQYNVFHETSSNDHGMNLGKNHPWCSRTSTQSLQYYSCLDGNSSG